MKTLVYWPLALILLAATVASGQDVRYSFDFRNDFSKYKTYKWVEIEHKEGVDAETDKQIKAAIDAELAKKGLIKRNADPTDLYIGYQFAVTAETEYRTYENDSYPQDWEDGWAGRRTSKSKAPSSKILYTGQLALDMYDSTRKEIVWRSAGTKSISPTASPEQRQRNIARTAAILLRPYPPKPHS